MTHRKWILGTVSCVTMLVVLLLGFTSTIIVAAKSPENIELNLSAPAQEGSKLSTPELIEQAFASGEITAEQRILYLTYALYDYKSLPSQYLSNVGWSGTSYVQEINAFREAISSGKSPLVSPTIEAEFALLSVQSATVCDMEDGPNSTESVNFHLNYNTIGEELTIEDYKTSLEAAFSTEVTTYGWAKPPFCTSGIGTCTFTNPWDKYPVQLADLGPGLSGRVQFGEPGQGVGNYIGQVGDNPNTPATETTARATCMVLNSDFSQIDIGLTAQQNLDWTTAHELNHAIQHGLGGSFQEDEMWLESTSKYIEDEVFDAINHNYRFLWPEFTSCLGEYPGGRPAYTNWLFFRYAAEQNGGTNVAGGGEDIMQAFWENVGIGQTGLTAYKNALATKEKNLDDTFHNYAIAARFAKSCPIASPYCFEEAAGYITAKGANQNHGEITSVGGSYSGNLQDNYAINWIGLPTSGPYSVVLENPSIFFGGEFRVSIVADTGNALEVTPFQSVADSNSRITLGYEPPAGATSVVAVITNQSQTAADPESCNPSPYKLSIPLPRPISFVIDDTGSMWNEIDIVKTTVAQKVDEFVTKSIFPTYHLLTYKDDVNYRGKTADPTTIKSWVNSLSASGGSSCPEEMLGALNRIAVEAPGSEAWVLTDAGFHGGPVDVAKTIFNLRSADVKTHFITYNIADWCFDSGSDTLSTEVGKTTIDQDNEQNGAMLNPELSALATAGPEAFVQIANETGGHYFQISTEETQAAANILLNEMVATSDLTHLTDEVLSASPKTYNISVDSTTTEANFLLNMFSGNGSLTLINPNGIPVNPSDPSVIYTAVSNAEYYQIANPMVGVWQAQISGDGTFTLSTSGNSSISLEYLSDTSLAKDKAVHLLASLTGPVASASFQFVHLDGTLLQTVNLFDDGLHEDGVAGDGIYGIPYTPTTAGNFYFRVEGTTSDSTEFERIATEMIRVQTLSVVAPADQAVSPGTTQVYDFSITNVGTVDETYDLAIISGQGWADLSGVSSSITVLAGATGHILIPVNVPITAVEGLVDEVVLTAVSQLNPLTHDSDSALTTVLAPNNFPSTPVLDNFNRANGSIGSNWSGYTSKYHITSNQMTVDYNGSNSYIYWKNVSFGADQEAYVTFTDIDATASEQDLLLKSQSKTTWGDGVIEVLYDPMGYTAQVWTYEWPAGWVQHGADIPVTFVNGDTFGARALANGIVEVYKNGTLLATRDITTWSHYSDGGYIGLWFIGAEDAVLDDFGGGTISGGMQSMLAGDESGIAASSDAESDSWNVEINSAGQFWQGIPIGTNQKASVTFATVPANMQGVLLKPQSNGVWGEDVVEVFYDVIGGRIQVWVYDAQTGNGWMQYGKDIPVKFAAGDTFSVQVLADGTVEIQRNAKLLAKRDVTP